MICQSCKSQNTIKKGFRRGKKRFYCKDCNTSFSVSVSDVSDVVDSQVSVKTERTDHYINIVCSSRRIFTKEDLIEEFDIDTDIWRLESFVVKTDEAWRKDRKVDWHVKDGSVSSGDVEDSGKILLVPLTRIHAKFVKKTIDDINLNDIRKSLSEIKPLLKFILIKPKRYDLNGKLLEINFADPHHGRLYADSGSKTLDIKIKETVNDIVYKSQGHKFKEIVFCQVGDIYNADNIEGSTTGGTKQNMSMKPHELFRHGLNQSIWMIDQFRNIAPVKYVFVPGNHDAYLSFCLAIALEEHYRNCKDVSFIINDDSKFAWYVFGVNLIAWTHGDIPKSNVFSWLPSKARKEWGRTKFAEIHMGHTNNQKVIESHGHIVRWLPSIADSSIWEDGEGYSGTLKASTSFIWDKDNGLEEQWFHNIK